MYTEHGHHIQGTTQLGDIPASEVADCGGPSSCRTCNREAGEALAENISSHPANLTDEIEEIKRLVVGRYKNSRERSLVLTKLDEAELWSIKCEPADQVGYLVAAATEERAS